jgi:hypothetical protein
VRISDATAFLTVRANDFCCDLKGSWRIVYLKLIFLIIDVLMIGRPELEVTLRGLAADVIFPQKVGICLDLVIL